jgi:F-type H+-transporting ATPase subunit delta
LFRRTQSAGRCSGTYRELFQVPSSKTGASGLAGRYATALFDLASEQKALDAVANDLKALSQMMAESAELARLIASPVIARDDQAKAMVALAERAGFHPLTRNIIGVLAMNRRLFALSGVIDSFLTLLSESRGEVTADVTSATPLSEQQVSAVAEALRQAIGSKVTVNTTVDKRLLGGLVVRVGSRMVDSSLRTKLQKLQLAMKGIG